MQLKKGHEFHPPSITVCKFISDHIKLGMLSDWYTAQSDAPQSCPQERKIINEIISAYLNYFSPITMRLNEDQMEILVQVSSWFFSWDVGYGNLTNIKSPLEFHKRSKSQSVSVWASTFLIKFFWDKSEWRYPHYTYINNRLTSLFLFLLRLIRLKNKLSHLGGYDSVAERFAPDGGVKSLGSERFHNAFERSFLLTKPEFIRSEIQ